jgi:hypothetical protein
MVFRGPFGVVIWVISAALGIGFVVLRTNVLDAVLPTEFMAALDSATTGADEGMEPAEVKAKRVAAAATQDGPGQFLQDDPEGLRVQGPIAAMAGNRPVLIKDVIADHKTSVFQDIPAEITMIRPISGCKPTPPLEGTVVGHVTAGSSGLNLAFLTYDDAALAAAVQDFVNAYRATGSTEVPTSPGIAYESYDVAVTDTRRPVYLVLVNPEGRRIWNIHLAEGARVERVVLLGGDHAGVANLDPVVPVEVMSDKSLAECGIFPAYPLNAGHRFFGDLADATGGAKVEAEQKLAKLQSRVDAWDTWFRDSFGVDAGTTRAGFDSGMISVVGPQPGAEEPKAVYAPIQGSRIRMTQDNYFEIVGQSTEADSFAGRVRAIATTFAFGDLTSLRQGVSF